MTPRVVVRRPTHHGHQQRNLRQVQLRERLAEIELARETEPVHGALAVLPEIDLVHVGVHEIRLREVRLERDRHRRFAQLAAQRLIGRQEVAAHELLREGAAALCDAARFRGSPTRARDRRRIDAVVRVELAVFDRLERGGSSSGGTSAGVRTMRSSPCVGKMLPISSGSKRSDRHFLALAVRQGQ